MEYIIWTSDGGPRHRPESVSPWPAVAPRPCFLNRHRGRGPRPQCRTAGSYGDWRIESVHVLPDTETRGGICLLWRGIRHAKTGTGTCTNGNSAACGAGRKVVVPKLVDGTEDLTEVSALATANSSRSLLEDADDDVADPAASLVQMHGMESAEALSQCAFSQPLTLRRLVLLSVRVVLFPGVCFLRQNFVVSHLTSRWSALCVAGER